MSVKDEISEIYIQINEPYAKKETVSKMEHSLERMLVPQCILQREWGVSRYGGK